MTRLADLGVSFEHGCFACGQLNPSGLHLELETAPNGVRFRFTGERAQQGYENTLHGGVVSALLDEAMAWSAFRTGSFGVTAKLSIEYRQPVPVGEELLVQGELVRDRGRGIETAGRIVRAADGRLLAKGTALFVRMPEERRAELELRYGMTEATLARIQADPDTERKERVQA